LVNDRILTDYDLLRFTPNVRGNLADVIGHASLKAGFSFLRFKSAFVTRHYTERLSLRAIGTIPSPKD
jgi:hypothetical protein